MESRAHLRWLTTFFGRWKALIWRPSDAHPVPIPSQPQREHDADRHGPAGIGAASADSGASAVSVVKVAGCAGAVTHQLLPGNVVIARSCRFARLTPLRTRTTNAGRRSPSLASPMDSKALFRRQSLVETLLAKPHVEVRTTPHGLIVDATIEADLAGEKPFRSCVHPPMMPPTSAKSQQAQLPGLGRAQG